MRQVIVLLQRSNHPCLPPKKYATTRENQVLGSVVRQPYLGGHHGWWRVVKGALFLLYACWTQQATRAPDTGRGFGVVY